MGTARFSTRARWRYILPMKERGVFLPALVLFLLSPMVAELLTSSSPPMAFFTPFGLLVMPCLYGSGALLARELVLRWDKGWPSLVALGASFGIAEEGLMVKSFFDTRWPGLGASASYGWGGGVGWFWALQMTAFHALFSIVIPIILMAVLFPRVRRRSFLGLPGIIVFSILLAADVALGGIALNRYTPPLVPYALSVLACAGCVAAARFLPRALPQVSRRTVAVPSPRAGVPAFFFLSMGCTIPFFLLQWRAPILGVPPVVACALTLLLVAGFFLAAAALRRRFRPSLLGLWGLAAGALSFFVVLSPFIPLDASRGNVQGMAYVGLGMALLLAGAFFRARRSDREDA
jgi:hypothetical protein